MVRVLETDITMDLLAGLTPAAAIAHIVALCAVVLTLGSFAMGAARRSLFLVFYLMVYGAYYMAGDSGIVMVAILLLFYRSDIATMLVFQDTPGTVLTH